jgi:SpoIIAA-like
MDTIFEGNSYRVAIDMENKIMLLHWFASTRDWEKEDYKRENLQLVSLVEQQKPAYLLSLSEEFAYPITPQDQAWLLDKVFVPYHQNGMKKIAIVMSQDFIAQLSIEQLVDESAVLPTRMFANQSEAKTWLLAR